MKSKLKGVFIAGIYIALSSSFVLAEGANTNSNHMNDRSQTNNNHMNGGMNGGMNGAMNAADRKTNRDVNADNSEMNSADRNRSRVTAEQQSNSKKDISITQRIRKELLKDGNLSTYAKNIKVITRNGKVVLKGPVNSQREKNSAGQIATNAVGAQNVQNEITITK